MDLEHIVTAIVTALITAPIGAGVTWLIALRKMKPEIRQTNATTAEIQGRTWLALASALQVSLQAALSQCQQLEVAMAAIRKEKELSDDLVLELRGIIAGLEARITVLLEQVKVLKNAEMGHEPGKEKA